MSFIKENTLFSIVAFLVGFIVFSAFVISFTSIMAVAVTIGISVTWLFPILFEASSISGALGKAYLEIKGIKDSKPRNMANGLLYIGASMSVIFNVYHVWDRIVEVGIPEGIIIGLGHALPSMVVVVGAEFVIYMSKTTFTKDAGMSLSEQIKKLTEKIITGPYRS